MKALAADVLLKAEPQSVTDSSERLQAMPTLQPAHQLHTFQFDPEHYLNFLKVTPSRGHAEGR